MVQENKIEPTEVTLHTATTLTLNSAFYDTLDLNKRDPSSIATFMDQARPDELFNIMLYVAREVFDQARLDAVFNYFTSEQGKAKFPEYKETLKSWGSKWEGFLLAWNGIFFAKVLELDILDKEIIQKALLLKLQLDQQLDENWHCQYIQRIEPSRLLDILFVQKSIQQVEVLRKVGKSALEKAIVDGAEAAVTPCLATVLQIGELIEVVLKTISTYLLSPKKLQALLEPLIGRDPASLCFNYMDDQEGIRSIRDRVVSKLWGFVESTSEHLLFKLLQQEEYLDFVRWESGTLQTVLQFALDRDIEQGLDCFTETSLYHKLLNQFMASGPDVTARDKEGFTLFTRPPIFPIPLRQVSRRSLTLYYTELIRQLCIQRNVPDLIDIPPSTLRELLGLETENIFGEFYPLKVPPFRSFKSLSLPMIKILLVYYQGKYQFLHTLFDTFKGEETLPVSLLTCATIENNDTSYHALREDIKVGGKCLEKGQRHLTSDLLAKVVTILKPEGFIARDPQGDGSFFALFLKNYLLDMTEQKIAAKTVRYYLALALEEAAFAENLDLIKQLLMIVPLGADTPIATNVILNNPSDFDENTYNDAVFALGKSNAFLAVSKLPKAVRQSPRECLNFFSLLPNEQKEIPRRPVPMPWIAKEDSNIRSPMDLQRCKKMQKDWECLFDNRVFFDLYKGTHAELERLLSCRIAPDNQKPISIIMVYLLGNGVVHSSVPTEKRPGIRIKFKQKEEGTFACGLYTIFHTRFKTWEKQVEELESILGWSFSGINAISCFRGQLRIDFKTNDACFESCVKLGSKRPKIQALYDEKTNCLALCGKELTTFLKCYAPEIVSDYFFGSQRPEYKPEGQKDTACAIS